jgi:hypothetical protein
MKAIKKIALLIIYILIGVSFQYTDPFNFLCLFFLSCLILLVSIGLLINDLFNRKFNVWYLTGFVPILVGIGFMFFVRDVKHKNAMKICTEIENYHQVKGYYPKSLEEIDNKIEITGLFYSVDSSGSNYWLEYLMDGFNHEFYDSKSKAWGSLGWND